MRHGARARTRTSLVVLATLSALVLSGAPSGAQGGGENVITNCNDTAGIRAAVAAGGDWQFRCTGFINFAMGEADIVFTKDVSLSVAPTYEVTLAWGDLDFRSPRAFTINGGNVRLSGFKINAGGASVDSAPDGTEGESATTPGGSGTSGTPPTVPGGNKEGGCIRVGEGAVLTVENMSFDGCYLIGISGGYGGGAGSGATGSHGANGDPGIDGTGNTSERGGDGGQAASGTFGGNGASGGSGTAGGNGLGGAIYNAGTLVVSNSTFTGNRAIGGYGGGGGYAGQGGSGGAGGEGGQGGQGGAPFGRGGDGGDSGHGGDGANGGSGGHGRDAGDGMGGAIYNAGRLRITNSTFTGNKAEGGEAGPGGLGGHGGSGGIAFKGGNGGEGGADPGCTGCGRGPQGLEGKSGNPGDGGNGGHGGSGGNGGDAFGGAIFSESPVRTDDVTGVTATDNVQVAGKAGAGATGGSAGPAGGSLFGGGYDTPFPGSPGTDGASGRPGTAGSLDIQLKPLLPPEAKFSFENSTKERLTIDFDASESKAAEGELVAYDWKFGDGKTDSGVTVSHTFEDPGKYEVELTVRDEYAQTVSVKHEVDVRMTLDVTVKAKPSRIEIEQTPKGPKPEKIAVKVTVKNSNPVTIKKVTLPEKIAVSLPNEPEATKKALKQTKAPTKKVGKKEVPDLNLGALKKGQSESRTYEFVLKGDGKYELEALVTGAAPKGETVRGVGKDDVEGTTPLLFMTAKPGARVRSQRDRRLIKAGTNYLINVTLNNRSYTKKIVVHPIWPKLTGNASDGHLQTPGRPIDYKPKGKLSEVRPSEYLEFGPRTKRKFDVLVRTSASDSWVTADEGGNGGGTRSTVEFAKPKVSIVEQGGEKITRASPKKVLLGEDSDKFVVHVDDSATPRPAFNAYEATLYIAKGVVVGLWNVTWGTVRGLLWDLPVLAIRSLLSLPPAALAYMNHQVELWAEVEGDPVLRAQFVNALLERVAVSFEEAPYMNQDKVIADLYNAVDRAVAEKYTDISRNWYDGDWRGAAEAMSTEVTERGVDIATGLAPAVLARMPRVAAKWEATRIALYARAAETLSTALQGVTRFRAAIQALRNVVRPGLAFTNQHLSKIFGVSAREADWVRNFVKGYRTKLGRRISIVFRSRLEQSLHWLDNGAYLKPYWLKLKNVNRVDTQYLGYFDGPPAPGDVGRLIVRRPPPWDEVHARLRANGVKTGSAEYEGVRIRWKQRTDEYFNDGEVQRMFEYNRKGEVDGKWPWTDNGVDPNIQADENFPAGFRLRRTRPGEFVIEIRPKLQNGEFGEWGSVTGDIDLIALTAADGTALTDEEHVDLLKALRNGPFGAQHPESATWIKKGEFWFKAKENYLKNDGECCLAEVGADGVIRAVQFNEKYSLFPKTVTALKAKHTYRIWWDGGYRAPPERSYFGVFGSLAGG